MARAATRQLPKTMRRSRHTSIQRLACKSIPLGVLGRVNKQLAVNKQGLDVSLNLRASVYNAVSNSVFDSLDPQTVLFEPEAGPLGPPLSGINEFS